MTIPIRKDIEDKLARHPKDPKHYPGIYVYDDSKKVRYIKVGTQIKHNCLNVPKKGYWFKRNALRDIVRCANVYKQLAEDKLYHPDTQIAVFEDRKDYSLMLVMPELDTQCESIPEIKREKTKKIQKKYGFVPSIRGGDILASFNWGSDGTDVYYHDAYIHSNYKDILKMAKRMKIK